MSNEIEIDMKPFQYLDKVQKGIDDMLAFLEDNHERALRKRTQLDYSTDDKDNFTEGAVKLLRILRYCDNDNTKAVYYRVVLDFVLECYFNALNACEYPANRE